MRFTSYIAAVVLLVGASCIESNGQAEKKGAEKGVEPIPSSDVATPGRATGKRRAPAGEESLDNNEGKPAEKCREERASVRVVFTGLVDFSEDDLLKRLGEQGAALPPNHLPDSASAAKAVAVLREFLQIHGYMNPSVELLNDYESKQVDIIISPGKRSSIGEVRFEGSRVFSSAQLARQTSECLAGFKDSRRGYNQEVFYYCIRRVTDFIRSQGYLQATLGEAKKQFSETALIITVPVNEGRLYRLGEIRIEGANVLAADQIRNLFNARGGDIANGEEIGKWLFEDLKRLYGRYGYIQFTAEVEPEFKESRENPAHGIVDLKVTIEEGRQFLIGSIRFSGSNLPRKDLRQLLALRDGEVFDQESFETSIRVLNQSFLFEPIDPHKDVEFKTDEESAVLNLVIKLAARSHNLN